MNSSETKDRLQQLFRSILDLPQLELTPNLSPADIAHWDSLANINIIMAIEREFAIKLTLEQMQKISNVGGMLDLIESKLSKK